MTFSLDNRILLTFKNRRPDLSRNFISIAIRRISHVAVSASLHMRKAEFYTNYLSNFTESIFDLARARNSFYTLCFHSHSESIVNATMLRDGIPFWKVGSTHLWSRTTQSRLSISYEHPRKRESSYITRKQINLSFRFILVLQRSYLRDLFRRDLRRKFCN